MPCEWCKTGTPIKYKGGMFHLKEKKGDKPRHYILCADQADTLATPLEKIIEELQSLDQTVIVLEAIGNLKLIIDKRKAGLL